MNKVGRRNYADNNRGAAGPVGEHGYAQSKLFTYKVRRGGTRFDALLRFARARLR
jgi:hypothetical protein